MSQSSFIDVAGLRHRFDVSENWLNRFIARRPRQWLRAVDDVSFEIGRGETFALVGESGSGKSTLARNVVGLLRANGGQIVIDGTELKAGAATPPELRKRIQMIFQDPYASLNPRWRVDRIIAEPIRGFAPKTPRAQVEARIAELLTLVGLHPDDRIKFPHQFSGGQRQRVAIARALASNADFIVCDEPTSALDVSVQAQILNLMRELQRKLELTYLFISHDLAVVRYMATRVGVMYLGKLVEVGTVDEIFANPRHPYTRMLLEAVPGASGERGSGGRIRGEVPSPIDPPPGCAFHPRCSIATDHCRQQAPAMISGVACHVANQQETGADRDQPL